GRMPAGGGCGLSGNDLGATATPHLCPSIACEISPIVQPFRRPRSSRWFRRQARVCASALPQPKSASEGIIVVAGARTGRQRVEFFDVASPNDRIVGLECGNEACHDIGDVAAPLLLAVLLQPAPAHVVFE